MALNSDSSLLAVSGQAYFAGTLEYPTFGVKSTLTNKIQWMRYFKPTGIANYDFEYISYIDFISNDTQLVICTGPNMYWQTVQVTDGTEVRFFEQAQVNKLSVPISGGIFVTNYNEFVIFSK